MRLHFLPRLERALTQEELAEKAGTTKSYTSKIKNDVKDARISTLQKIVEEGSGVRVQSSIELDQEKPSLHCIQNILLKTALLGAGFFKRQQCRT